MRIILIIACLAVTACAQPYVPAPTLTLEEQFASSCAENGFEIGTKDNNTCVQAALKAREKAIKKAQKQYEDQQRAIVKAALDADKAKCRSYGFKGGTDQFATCMMQIEQAKKQEQQHNQDLAVRQEIAQQQIEQNKRAALLQYLGQQQAIQAQQNQRLRTNCTTSQMGAFGQINCY